MKYILNESTYKKYILFVLNNEYKPDYGWGSSFIGWHKKDLEKYGYLDFTIAGESSFVYIGHSDDRYKPKTLLIQPWLAKELNILFDKGWEYTFVEWFENAINLKVDHFLLAI